MSQCEMILKHLKTHVGITPTTALEKYGVMRLAARISDLRGQGYQITTVRREAINRFGKKVEFAEYRMVGASK